LTFFAGEVVGFAALVLSIFLPETHDKKSGWGRLVPPITYHWQGEHHASLHPCHRPHLMSSRRSTTNLKNR
jgi:hypothetical protein